jgi:hypothetical protein
MRRDACIPGLILLAFILLPALGNARAFVSMGKKPPLSDLPKSGNVTVRVVFPDGSPAAGATVTIGRQRFTADPKGTVPVPGIPAAHGVATADTRRQEGGFLGLFRKNVRYTAFSAVQPSAGNPLEVQLTLGATPDLDSRCRSCHPDKPTGVSPMVKCTHSSGVPVKPALANRVAQFNQENEVLRKAGKPYYPAIVLEQRRVKKGLFGEDQPFLTCESCHSNHVETGEFAYVLMPFAEKSILCRGCHV